MSGLSPLLGKQTHLHLCSWWRHGQIPKLHDEPRWNHSVINGAAVSKQHPHICVVMVQVGDGVVQSQWCCYLQASNWKGSSVKWRCDVSFDYTLNALHNNGGECLWATVIEEIHIMCHCFGDDGGPLEGWGDNRQKQGEVENVCDNICQCVSAQPV